MIVILSPHCDDAILSLGQFMTTAPCTVVTVFAGIPSSGLSAYDESCGFTESSTAMRTRRLEDQRACELLGANVVHLDFLDAQYQYPADDATITKTLEAFYRPDWRIFAPVGIGHPDHVQTARCARAAMAAGTQFAFEELPYRVQHPEQVIDALNKIRAEGWDIADLPDPLEQGARNRKAAALERYDSQFPTVEAAHEPMFLCPERCWRIAR